MKVLYLVSGIGPPAGWGTEFIQNTIIELCKKNVEATIITPIYKHTHPKWKSWIDDLSYKYKIKFVVIQSPSWVKKSLTLHFIFTPFFVTFMAIKLLRKERFDIIHEFSSIPIILIRSLIFKLFFNVNTIFSLSVYNTTFLGNFIWFRLFDFGKYYLIPSKEIIYQLKKLGIKENKIHFVPPALDLQRFNKSLDKNLARSKLNLPNDKYIISYFGPLTEEKGVVDIVKAARKLNKALQQKCFIVLYVIWKGSNEHEKLTQKISNVKLPFVKIRQEFVDIPTLLSASDSILLPQRTGIGTTIPPIATIETLACGKPIITTNIIGNREWVTPKRGILIKPAKPEAIAEAIEKIINFKVSGHDDNLEVFDIKKVTEKYLQIYRLTGFPN